MRFHTMIAILIGAVLAPFAAASEEIHLAAKRGDAQKVQALLDQGVPPDQLSTRHTTVVGVTPMYVAAKFGKLDVVRTLLDAGADPLYSSTNLHGEGAPIHLAAQNGHGDIVAFFLDRGVDIDLHVKWIATPLHQARVRNHEDVVDMLLARGAASSFAAPPIAEKLAAADVANGEKVGKQCVLCHEYAPVEADKAGKSVSLYGIVGRAMAAQEGFPYSQHLTAVHGQWTYENLNSFLASPMRFAPGTAMYYALEDEASRIDLIAYLRTLSPNPVPLP